MADIQVRNLDKKTVAALSEMARNRHMSREEFLRRSLVQLTQEQAIRETEERYATLIKKLEDVLLHNMEVIEHNSFLLEEIQEKI